MKQVLYGYVALSFLTLAVASYVYFQNNPVAYTYGGCNGQVSCSSANPLNWEFPLSLGIVGTIFAVFGVRIESGEHG